MQNSKVEIISSADDLSALAEEWNDLAIRCPGYFLSQTFQWTETAWQIIGQPRGHELNCLTLRSGGRLVAVWPLVISRDRGLRTIRRLGFGGHEYCAPLVEPGDEAESRTSLLWQTAARSADFAVLRHVRADSLLAGVLKAGNHLSVTEDAAPAPYIVRADYPDWAAYYATISSQLRTQIKRRRRKLAAEGSVVLERASRAGCAALIDWILEHKRRWLVHANLAGDWLFESDSRDFLVALAAREDATGGVALFALKVDGVPIAAEIASVDRGRFESYMVAYDPKWKSYSPGNILSEYTLQWAFDRGLDFDLRIGNEPYKYRWAKRSCDTVIWHVATGKRGIPAIVHLRFAMLVNRTRQKVALGRFLSPKWCSWLKAIRERWGA